MSNLTEHPRNGEIYHAYYFGFDGTGTPVDKVLKAVARAGACFHHTEQWADDDGQTCHMNQIQLAADQVAAEVIALRALVGTMIVALEHSTDCLNNGDHPITWEKNKTLIAKAKEQVK